MLAFAPQAWTSDDTDAIERLNIQWGTSLAYPLSSMAAHVAAVPNHQTGRITPLATRAAVAFFGVVRLRAGPDPLDRRRAAARSRTRSRSTRPTASCSSAAASSASRSPFEEGGNQTAWMVVAPDRVARDRRLLPGPQPARAGRRPAAAARARSEAVYRVSGWPDDGDPLYRDNAGTAWWRRADGRRLVARRRAASKRARGGISGPGSSCSRPSSALSWCARSPFCGRTAPLRTDPDHTHRSDGAHAARGDEAQ